VFIGAPICCETPSDIIWDTPPMTMVGREPELARLADLLDHVESIRESGSGAASVPLMGGFAAHPFSVLNLVTKPGVEGIFVPTGPGRWVYDLELNSDQPEAAGWWTADRLGSGKRSGPRSRARSPEHISVGLRRGRGVALPVGPRLLGWRRSTPYDAARRDGNEYRHRRWAQPWVEARLGDEEIGMRARPGARAPMHG